MRRHGSLNKSSDAEVDAAASEAAKGAVTGAVKWGCYAAALGAAGYVLSPIYRGLTVQFKVFLQMSGMTLGSMIEADRRLRLYEGKIRRDKKLARDEAIWRASEAKYHSDTRRNTEDVGAVGDDH